MTESEYDQGIRQLSQTVGFVGLEPPTFRLVVNMGDTFVWALTLGKVCFEFGTRPLGRKNTPEFPAMRGQHWCKEYYIAPVTADRAESLRAALCAVKVQDE